MGAFSNFLEDTLLKHIFRGTAYTAATTVYVSLHTTLPTEDNVTPSEVSGNAYARVATVTSPTGSSVWAAPTVSGAAFQTSNSGAINYPTPGPAGWGTVTSFAIYDALTAGNLLFLGPLTASKVINAGDAVSFAAGALVIQLD